MKKAIVLVSALLLAGCFQRAAAPRPQAPTPQAAQPQTQPSQVPERANIGPVSNDIYPDQEKSRIVLNFKDTHVVMTGYPYMDKDYRPRLFNLIYVNTIYESNDMVNLTDPSNKWANIYEFSTTEPRIYMPVGRSDANKPIWQTMDIVNTADADKTLVGCTATPYVLTGSLAGTSYHCTATDANKDSAGSDPCFVPVADGQGILYRQYSADGSANGSMCEILKRNYIISITFQKDI